MTGVDSITMDKLMQLRVMISEIVVENWNRVVFQSDRRTPKINDLVYLEHGDMTQPQYKEYMQNENTRAGRAEIEAARLYYSKFTIFMSDDKFTS